MILYLLLAVGLTALDQLIKYLSVVFLKGEAPFTIISGFFRLRYVENNGAAFSMFKGKQIFLILVTAAAALFFIYLLKSGTIHGRLGYTAMALVFGGAVGNFIDRVRLGYVVDMFEWCWFNFPVFNFADLCITAGAVLFALMLWFDYRAEKAGKTGKSE